jgi:urease subunit gamma
VIYQVADLRRRRKDPGLKLNFPESTALITEALLEAARDGKSVAEVIELGKQILIRDGVMDGVPEMVTVVQVEATFPLASRPGRSTSFGRPVVSPGARGG